MLPTFEQFEHFPETDSEISLILASPKVSKIQHFALGPEGTNIAQACAKWINRMQVGAKASIALCRTPEESIDQARKYSENDAIAFFWTCAVYYKENSVFFDNPDLLPFFTQETFELDNMQLCTTQSKAKDLLRLGFPQKLRIASHPSPQNLIRSISSCTIVSANSNSEAALLCAREEVDACITTESARRIHRLVSLHSFGSPKMIFFGGITSNGARLIQKIKMSLVSSDN